MTKQLMKLAALIVALSISGALKAYEFRAPLATERGQLRYRFADMNQKSYRWSTWSALHSRGGDKAFADEDNDTVDYATLFFGEDEFTLSSIFPNGFQPINAEFYNPFLNVVTIQPSASYAERGASWGGRIDFLVWDSNKGKGRIGLRAMVPFRDIQILDEADHSEESIDDVLDDLVIKQSGPLQFNDFATGVSQVVNADDKRAYRMDLVDSLPQSRQLTPMINWANLTQLPGKKAVTVADQAVYESVNLAAATQPKMGVVTSPAGVIPYNKVGVVIDPVGGGGITCKPTLTALPANLQLTAAQINAPESREVFTFDETGATGVDYSGNSIDGNPNGGVPPVGLPVSAALIASTEAAKSTLWFTTVHTTNGNQDPLSNSVVSAIENSLRQFTQSPTDWLEDFGGFEFTSRRLQGLGDIDLDLFYEHRFDQDWVLEAMLGVRFPTGAGSRRALSPYQVQLGNGEHWEIKLGFMGAWQATSWLNMKLDTYWSFVLESDEEVGATFAGAGVRGFGPSEDADISWGYFVGRFDFNFFHPKDSNLCSTIGYEFYYRTENDMHFDDSTLPAWFGRLKNVVLTDPQGATLNQSGPSAGNITFTDAVFDLDDDAASEGTEQYAHRLRSETSYKLSEHFEIFLGGEWTFAGMNMPRESDLFVGFNMKFH